MKIVSQRCEWLQYDLARRWAHTVCVQMCVYMFVCVCVTNCERKREGAYLQACVNTGSSSGEISISTIIG